MNTTTRQEQCQSHAHKIETDERQRESLNVPSRARRSRDVLTKVWPKCGGVLDVVRCGSQRGVVWRCRSQLMKDATIRSYVETELSPG